MKIYTNYLNLVYCLLIYFNVIVMYDIVPYSREQKHVLLFRKPTLRGVFQSETCYYINIANADSISYIPTRPNTY